MGACLSCRFTTIGQSLVKFKKRTSSHTEKIPSLQELILYEEAQHEATQGKIET